MSNGKRIVAHRASTPALAPMTAIRHRGYCDVAQGLGFPRDYDTWPEDEQRNYERGRHQHALARAYGGGVAPKWPRNMRLATVINRALGAAVSRSLFRETAVSTPGGLYSGTPEHLPPA